MNRLDVIRYDKKSKHVTMGTSLLVENVQGKMKIKHH